MVIEKIKILLAVLSYQLNTTANSANPPRKCSKWAEFELISINTCAPQFK
jgi:hypothetical protein